MTVFAGSIWAFALVGFTLMTAQSLNDARFSIGMGRVEDAVLEVLGTATGLVFSTAMIVGLFSLLTS